MNDNSALQTGVLLVVNGDYGRALVDAAEVVVGELGIVVVMVCAADHRSALERRILRAVEQVDEGAAVLLLTDLCGSTPANVCLVVAEHPSCEVVAGVNLAMLLKLSTCDRRRSAAELALELKNTGQRSVVTGAELRKTGGSRGS